MSERSITAWEALDGGWLYLGRPITDGYDIATLIPSAADGARALPVAVAFTSEAAAAGYTRAAPAGVELLRLPAGDPRAKEEWLRALEQQGVRTLVFDPPAALADAVASSRAIAVHLALGYILSQRRSSACL